MTTYNTSSDSANTNVRALLTKVGEYYLGRSFNTASGRGKVDWKKIKEDTFDSKCAYCGEELTSPTIEHLVMFNRDHCGLHHPGNIVPCCRPCNSSRKKIDGVYVDWEDHLLSICSEKKHPLSKFKERKARIINHIKSKKYPKLTEDEINALKSITKHLYSSTKSELDQALALYRDIDETLVNRRD